MNYEFYPENCQISLFVEFKEKVGIALLLFMKLCIMYKQVFKQKGD